MNYTVSTNNEIVIGNKTIVANGFGSILFKNTGLDIVYINDNIAIAPGSSFVFDNHPNVVIAENFTIRFAGAVPTKSVLVLRSYFKAVGNANN